MKVDVVQVTKADEIEALEPVTVVWDDILLLSVNGIVDSVRAQRIMETVLEKIRETNSKVIILDLTGVEAIDTAVANHLIKIIQASSLMGCQSIISGIWPGVAQALVELGIPLRDIVTRATIRDALAYSFEQLEIEVTNKAAH